MGLAVGLDGDDTLWHNEKIFSMTEDRFRTLVGPYAEGVELDQRLIETERRNLALLGFGVMSFTLSMVETAIKVTDGRVPARVLGQLVEAGKEMLAHPVELLAGVEETVAALAIRWPLILVTKGDLFHQESKLARSGLLSRLSRVEIVSDKTPDVYRRVLAAAGVAAADFVMVGDSVRSDIAPVVAIGGRAILIPGYREWELERGDAGADSDGRWWRVTSIREVPAILDALATNG